MKSKFMETLKILILDDEKNVREELGEFLAKLGYSVIKEGLPSKALSLLKEEFVDIVILDIKLPEMEGTEVLKKIKEIHPDTEVIMISGHGEMNHVIDALRYGASDYFAKPFRLMDVQHAIERTRRYIHLQNKYRELQQDYQEASRILKESNSIPFIGDSAAVKQMLSLMSKVSKSPDTTVLITGESGTGKELIARGIHYLSERRNKTFYAVNSSAIPHELLESEFFGHIRGSFTGATNDKKGLFELANHSTLFLDEIGDMPISLQSKLLRVLEERTFSRVGSHTEIDTDVRIIAATNQDLGKLAEDKRFRMDLFHRLNSLEIHVPPLRERREDIPLLIDYFIRYFAEKMNKTVAGIDNSALRILADYDYPGNIRELKNMIERAVILSDGKQLGRDLFAEGSLSGYQDSEDNETGKTFDLAEIEKKTIRNVLKICGNNKSKAAEMLHITWQSLHRKMEKYGIRD